MHFCLPDLWPNRFFDVRGTQIESGMQGVERLADGTLDISVLGSTPMTIALRPPRELPLQIIAVHYEDWEAEALVVRSEIHSPDVRCKMAPL